jgi:hypothetical protein
MLLHYHISQEIQILQQIMHFEERRCNLLTLRVLVLLGEVGSNFFRGGRLGIGVVELALASSLGGVAVDAVACV